MPCDPDLDGSFSKFQLLPLPLAELLNILGQFPLAISVKHLPLPNDVNHCFCEDTWTSNTPAEFGPDNWRIGNILPEHLILSHESQINHSLDVIDSFYRLCAVQKDEAVVHCRTEGAAVESRCDVVKATEEPIPAFVVVFATSGRIGTSWWKVLACNATRLADLLQQSQQPIVSQGTAGIHKRNETASIVG